MPPVTVVPKPRDQPRLPAEFTRSRAPDSLTDALGRFHRAAESGGQVVYRRADTNLPVGGVWAVVTPLGSGSSEPALGQDGQELTLRASVAYTRRTTAGGPLPGIYERVSDGDGETFEPERLMIPNGLHPRRVQSLYTGEKLLAAYVTGSPGTLQAVYQGPADAAWSALFTFTDAAGQPLYVKNDSFSLSLGHEPGTGLIRWVLSVVIAGESEVSEWTSDAEPDWVAPSMSWERVV